MSAATPTESRAQTLDVELWPIERPIPYEGNPRHCPAAAVKKVAASLRSYGFRQPIVVDQDGVIIAGHTRLLAAKKLGLALVPVHVADLSPEAVRAYRLADNRSAQETSWNDDLLAEEIAALSAIDYDLGALGFEDEELAQLLGMTGGGQTDPDLVPEAPVEPVTRPGDLWILGEHRLLCGDSTKAEDVARVMDGKRAVLMATDPPYLVNYKGGVHPPTVGNGGKAGGSYERSWDAYVDPATSIEFYADFLNCALKHALCANPAIYQWFASSRVELVLAAWRRAGLLAHQQLIWHKSRSVLTRSDYLWNYEPCLYGWVTGKRPTRKPPADATAVWEIPSSIEDSPGAVHPTIKPAEITRRPILYHTQSGECIYEPFCGSGTAIIAAQMTNRCCAAIELSPIFCDVAVTRWERFAGVTAVRT